MGSEELAAAGAELAVEGVAEVAAGVALEETAKEVAVAGVGEIAQGAAELGAAAALEGVD